MGIDIHALNFVRYATKKQDIGDTVTIGRQGLHVIQPVVRQAFAVKADYRRPQYSEQIFTDYLGANRMVSVDNRPYEGATYIHDMNQELPQELWKWFDMVIDGGCVEHVFNAPPSVAQLFLVPKARRAGHPHPPGEQLLRPRLLAVFDGTLLLPALQRQRIQGHGGVHR
jgi:hypothetical protein